MSLPNIIHQKMVMIYRLSLSSHFPCTIHSLSTKRLSHDPFGWLVPCFDHGTYVASWTFPMDFSLTDWVRTHFNHLFSMIYGIILPIDWLSYVSEGWLNRQPGNVPMDYPLKDGHLHHQPAWSIVMVDIIVVNHILTIY